MSNDWHVGHTINIYDIITIILNYLIHAVSSDTLSEGVRKKRAFQELLQRIIDKF